MSIRLAIFDCDGTLVDSQYSIVAAMGVAFDAVSLPRPSRSAALQCVSLSLPHVMARLTPDSAPDVRDELCERYKVAFQKMRADGALQEPLYPGIAELLARLETDGWLLAIATGKSDRGLRHLLHRHGLAESFISLQTADRHPSKPHPSMIETALADAGAERSHAVMIGDTSFDMEMAAAAGVRALGVGWGYHSVSDLLDAGAQSVAMDSEELARHIGTYD